MNTAPTLSQLGFGNLIGQSWNLTKKNFGSLAKIFFFSFVMLFALQLVTSFILSVSKSSDFGTQVGALIYVLTWILQMIITMGWINVAIKIARGEAVDFQDLLAKKHRIFHYLLASLLLSLLVMVGFILFIVPGIYLLFKYSYVMSLVIDREMGVMDALKASSKMTDGSKGTLFLYGFGFLGITILGIIPLFLGLIVVIPLLAIANAVMYLYLLPRTGK